MFSRAQKRAGRGVVSVFREQPGVLCGYRRTKEKIIAKEGEKREQVHTDNLVSIISSLTIHGRDDRLRTGW